MTLSCFGSEEKPIDISNNELKNENTFSMSSRSWNFLVGFLLLNLWRHIFSYRQFFEHFFFEARVDLSNIFESTWIDWNRINFLSCNLILLKVRWIKTNLQSLELISDFEGTKGMILGFLSFLELYRAFWKVVRDLELWKVFKIFQKL